MIKDDSLASDRHGRLIWFAVVVLALFIGVQHIDGTLTFIRGSDAVSYVLLAKAIATGQGFSDINIPGAPQHTQYPPVLPLLLAPVYRYLGFNFYAMKAVMLAFGLGSLYTVRRLFAYEAGLYAAMSIALLVATNYYFVTLEGELMSEVPYLFFAMLALWCFNRYSREDAPAWSYFILPSLLAAAYLTRMIGVTLYAAMALALFIKLLRAAEDRKEVFKKLVFFTAAAGAPAAAWIIRNTVYSRGTTYQAIFMRSDYYALDSGQLAIPSLAGRFVENLGYYVQAVPTGILATEHLKGLLPPSVVTVVSLVMLALVLAGFIHELWRKRAGAMELYVLLYFSLLTVWPVYGSGDAIRYVVPMLPLVYYYLFVAVKAVSGRVPAIKGQVASRPRLVLAACLAVFLIMNLVEINKLVLPPGAARKVSSKVVRLPGKLVTKSRVLTPEALGVDYFRDKVPCYTSYILTADALKGSLKQGDIVMARKPELAALITGGYAVRFPYTSDPVMMGAFIEKNSVDYAILDVCYPEAEEYLLPYVNARPGSFKVVLNDSDRTVTVMYAGNGPTRH